jgi:hypothetical protein
MPEPDPPVVVRHHVLADPTGRRHRRLAIAGRVATTALGVWLVVLILGGLGLQPLAGLPIVGDLGGREAAPPPLPTRVQSAVARHTTVPRATVAVRAPVRSVSVPSRTPAVTAPSPARTRPPARTTPATSPGRTKTTPGRGRTSPAPAVSSPKSNPSTTAPGQTRNPPGQTRNPPGQTRNPPGQTKTAPGPPPSTPGTTSGGNSKGKGNLRGATGTVTTP